MSDTNRVALGLIRETTLGVLPSSPTIKALRITGTPSLAYKPKTIVSDEIRPDRQITDLTLVGAEVGGDVGQEISSRSVDDVLESAMFSTYVRQPFRDVGNVGAVTTGSVALTDTSGAGGGTFVVNDLVRFEGFAVAANNGVFAALASTSATVINATGLVAEANPPDATVRITRVGRLGASGDIVATLSGGAALTATTLNFTTLGLAVGDWIKIGDGGNSARSFATAACNVFARITAIAASRLDLYVASTFAADTGSGKTILIAFADRLQNGTTMQSFDLERRYTDHSPETVELFLGAVVNQLEMTLQPQAIMLAKATVLGLSASVANPTAPGDYSNIYSGSITRLAAPDNTVLNTSSNVGRLGRGTDPVSGPNFVIGATVSINNNLRGQAAIGTLGYVGIGVGEFGVTGKLDTYFGDKTLLNLVLTNAESSVDFAVRDATGRAYVVDLPRIKFSDGAPDVPGKNQDVSLSLPYQAIRHTTLGYTMAVYRFGYAA